MYLHGSSRCRAWTEVAARVLERIFVLAAAHEEIPLRWTARKGKEALAGILNAG